HDLVDSLHVHVLETRLGLIRTLVVDIVGLLGGERGFWIEIAYVDRALNIVLEARSRQRKHVHHTRGAVDALRAEARIGNSVDDQLLGVRVKPDAPFERLILIVGQPLLGPIPQPGRLGDVRIAVEGRKGFGHGCKFLNRHCRTSQIAIAIISNRSRYSVSSHASGSAFTPLRAKIASISFMSASEMFHPTAPTLSLTSRSLRHPTSAVLITGFESVQRSANWGRVL